MNNQLGIYIHIPFCISKCYYCDFASFSGKENIIEEYVYALCEEILKNTEILSQYKVTTIYIGGGTPSYIDSKYISQIIDTIKLCTDTSDLQEVTIEINPNSITKEKLQAYKASGINRLSIGLQSTHDDILKKIGRAHNFSHFKEALTIANIVGFNNISVDIIYPLPDLTFEMFKDTVNYVSSLEDKNIKHISVYNLEVHENTKLAFLLKEGYVKLVDEDEEYKMYTYLKDKLEDMGYKRYEISNYAKPTYESKHNLKYWSQEQYLGFGSGAASFFGGTRYTNIKDVDKYIENIKNDISVVDYDTYEELDLLSLMKEYIMLALRKKEGLDISKFKTRYKKDVYDIFADELNELLHLGLIERKDNNIFLTSRGSEVANLVWEKFV